MPRSRLPMLRVLPGPDNPPVRRGFVPFLYEPASAAGLRRLRECYDLLSVTRGSANDWEEILRLRDWLSARWDHGFHNTAKGASATGLDYLRRSECGESFTCAVFAFTLVEILTAVGIPARNLTIGRGHSDFIGPTDEVGHCVCEAWSNHFRKWIVLDADAGAHYVSEGTPLSALEIRAAWMSGRWKEIDFVRAPRCPAIRYDSFDGPRRQLVRGLEDFYRHNAADFYEHLIYQMSNRHFFRPRPPRRLTWCDAACPPRIVRYNEAVQLDDCIPTHRRDDVEYSLNHAFLRVVCQDRPDRKPVRRVVVHAETVTPWFSHFEAKFDGRSWRKTALPCRWTLHEGDNTLSVRPVNAFGRKGSESAITVRMKGLG